MSQICFGPHNQLSKQRRLNSFGEQRLEGKDMIYLIVISLSDFNTIRDIITDTHTLNSSLQKKLRVGRILNKIIDLEVAFLEKGLLGISCIFLLLTSEYSSDPFGCMRSHFDKLAD